jgi:hypothetical protein
MDLSILTITELKRLINAASRRIYRLQQREALKAKRKELRDLEGKLHYNTFTRKPSQALTLAQRQAIQAAAQARKQQR